MLTGCPSKAMDWTTCLRIALRCRAATFLGVSYFLRQARSFISAFAMFIGGLAFFMGSILSPRGLGGNRRAGSTGPVLSFIEGLTTGFYDCDLLACQVVEIVDEAVNLSVCGVDLLLEAGLLAPDGPLSTRPSLPIMSKFSDTNLIWVNPKLGLQDFQARAYRGPIYSVEICFHRSLRRVPSPSHRGQDFCWPYSGWPRQKVGPSTVVCLQIRTWRATP